MIANNKVKCGILNFAEARPGLRNSNSINTKFGGQPDWLQEPQWPLSQTSGNPMQFICQIILDKKNFSKCTK